MPPRRRGERRDERLSRIGFAAGGVPGVNALFCRALARGCQKKGLTRGGRTRMRVKERRSSGSFTPEAGGIQRPMAERPSHRWKEVGGVAGNSPLKWGAGDVWLTRGEKAFSPAWTCVLLGSGTINDIGDESTKRKTVFRSQRRSSVLTSENDF